MDDFGGAQMKAERSDFCSWSMRPAHKSRSVPLASLVSSPADSPFSGLCGTSISPGKRASIGGVSCLFVSRVNSDSNPLLLASHVSGACQLSRFL